MKVALLGNRHQANHVLVRLLRDRGVDAYVFNLASETTLNHPANDCKSLDFSEYSRTLTFGDPIVFGESIALDVRRALGPYGVLIASGNAPAFLAGAGLRADIVIADDATLHAARFHLHAIRRKTPRALWNFPIAQRDAFQQARSIVVSTGSGQHCTEAASLAKSVPYTFRLPAVYTHNHHYASLIGTQWGSAIAEVRAACDVLLVHPSRHQPSARSWFSDLVAGLARLRERRPRLRVTLITTETGPDLAATQALVHHARLSDSIRLFPAMARKDLLFAVCTADAVVSTPPGHGGLAQGDREAEELGTPMLTFPHLSLHQEGPLTASDRTELTARTIEHLVENLDARQAEAETAANHFALVAAPAALNQVLRLLHPPLMA